jgi:hypothetical protein
MLKSKKDSSVAENHYTTQDKTKRTTQILNTKSKTQRLLLIMPDFSTYRVIAFMIRVADDGGQ